LAIIERLNALEAQSRFALGRLRVLTGRPKRGQWLSLDEIDVAQAGKKRELAADFVSTLRAVQVCREALDRGDFLELAYNAFGAVPSVTKFFARQAERSLFGARAGGKKRSTHERDAKILAAYEADLASSNVRSPGASRRRMARKWEMKEPAIRKALQRARRARNERKLGQPGHCPST
jgi:hypothetical protein